ncbi:hypothetical protein BRADI_4g06685v3 [Brachypodium distachyon]|uniref:Uncharacterized protein n=1 Tax=Brachypodium distachyon TaxID=15368 RepID=A0A0Q3H045_BRADI|nr:hypothetical protein BRADI_4g06685v3 [Brachypodium distachyon]
MSTSTWLAWCRLESKFGTTSLPRTPSCRDILQQYEYSSVLQERCFPEYNVNVGTECSASIQESMIKPMISNLAKPDTGPAFG